MSTKLDGLAAGLPQDPVGLGDGRRLLRLLIEAITELRRHHRHQKTVRELMRPDDRTLADIGLDRSEIHSIAMDLPGRRRR